MNPINELKSTWHSIPDEVKTFLKRALLIFIIWKIIYNGFLFNGRIIDKPLTDFTSYSTMSVLYKAYPENKFFSKEESSSSSAFDPTTNHMYFVYMNGKKVIGIADVCNGLELYILYIGFLFCFPIKWKRIILFLLAGIITIYIVNVLRCAGIAVLNIRHNYLTDVAHHYVFKLIVYLLIFILWVMYAKNNFVHHEK
jgi:exosortase family protein XrtF